MEVKSERWNKWNKWNLKCICKTTDICLEICKFRKLKKLAERQKFSWNHHEISACLSERGTPSGHGICNHELVPPEGHKGPSPTVRRFTTWDMAFTKTHLRFFSVFQSSISRIFSKIFWVPHKAWRNISIQNSHETREKRVWKMLEIDWDHLFEGLLENGWNRKLWRHFSFQLQKCEVHELLAISLRNHFSAIRRRIFLRNIEASEASWILPNLEVNQPGNQAPKKRKTWVSFVDW